MIYVENKAKTTLNAMILGQTGVGKSSLINYLFDLDEKNELAAGAGSPVTPEGKFAKKTISRESLDITIYDSWGLENKRIEKWEEIIFGKIESLKNSFETRIHAIIYCISYSRSRIQDFEIQFISDLLKKNEHVIIALTQADCGSPETKQEYNRILSERLSKFKDLYDVVEVRSVAKPKIGQAAGSCCRFGKEDIFKTISANYLIYLVLQKMEAWESHIDAVVRKVANIDSPEFDKINDSIAESVLKTFAPPKVAVLGALALRLLSNWANLPFGDLAQSVAGEANESLSSVIREINGHIKNFQKDLHIDSMLFAWGEYVAPGIREIGTWDKIKEMVLNEPVKGNVQLESFWCWVKKVSASIKIKYLNTLSDNHRAKIIRDTIYNCDWKKMVILCYSFQFLGKRISRDLFIRGVGDTEVFKSRLVDFSKTNHIKPSEILVHYDDTIFMGKESFALTSDQFYYHNGDEMKSIDLETNGTAIYPIMDEITKENHFSDVRSELKNLLVAITKEYSLK